MADTCPATDIVANVSHFVPLGGSCMLKFTKRRATVVLGVIAVLVVAGAAIAYWTAGGSGDGTAATSNPTDQLTVNQTGTLTAMYPGDSPQTLSGTFDNPTGNLVRVNKVTVSIA